MHGKVSRSSQIRQAMASLESCGQRETGKLLLTSVYILMNGESPSSNIVMYYSGAPEADLKWGGYGLLEVLWAPKAPPRENLKFKTKHLISGNFSGYSELDLRCKPITSAHTR